MTEHLDDKELLVQFREATTKERSFTLILKKYQEKLYWHIRRMVVSHEDANDVLQNMFIKVWNALENFREDSQLYTWLYRIATNECLTFLEKEKKRSSVSFSDVETGLSNKLQADKHFDANKLEWTDGAFSNLNMLLSILRRKLQAKNQLWSATCLLNRSLKVISS